MKRTIKLWGLRAILVLIFPIAIVLGFAEEFWRAAKFGWIETRASAHDFRRIWRDGDL